MTHGTATGYVYHRCRCNACRAANSARIREYRKRRTTTMPSGHRVTTPGTTEIAPGAACNDPGAGPEPHGGPEHG